MTAQRHADASWQQTVRDHHGDWTLYGQGESFRNPALLQSFPSPVHPPLAEPRNSLFRVVREAFDLLGVPSRDARCPATGFKDFAGSCSRTIHDLERSANR
ncbi:hypothetical protein L284_10885 [Novosphingobium lindaniclasticum LE124]|uniref:Uncharacterized protein n=1 Tax=Novosphingobium lindaniclasticum LE124 TaxID=1096930 RepID=T0IVQ1_9SPHN|nr:hypothetical protein L284_10885 [Novosphingobium lindaniclasticum LE124]